MAIAQIAVECSDVLGESAVWHPKSGTLYWLDLARPGIHSLMLSTGEHSIRAIDALPPLGALVRSTSARHLLLARRDGIVVLDRLDGSERFVAHPAQGRDDLVYNDAAADSKHRLWIGTAEEADENPTAVLFCVEPSGRSRVADKGFTVGNGPALSPDGVTMYFSDTSAGRILAYSVDSDGALSERRIFASIPEEDGLPDGLAVDAEGGVWAAHWGGSQVSRWSPDGVMSGKVRVPTPNVTSLAFAGPGLTQLFMTTASEPFAECMVQPGSGALYVVEPGVAGNPVGESSLGFA
jgi:D-xylonolactonase